MNMIEKVARTLFSKIDINCAELDPNSGHWDTCTNDYKEKYIIIAKAAIEAMRDLVKMTPNGTLEDDVQLNYYIDAALKE